MGTLPGHIGTLPGHILGSFQSIWVLGTLPGHKGTLPGQRCMINLFDSWDWSCWQEWSSWILLFWEGAGSVFCLIFALSALRRDTTEPCFCNCPSQCHEDTSQILCIWYLLSLAYNLNLMSCMNVRWYCVAAWFGEEVHRVENSEGPECQ